MTIRNALLIALAAGGLAGCGFPETKMEPVSTQLQPGNQAAAPRPADEARAKQNNAQRGAGQPSG